MIREILSTDKLLIMFQNDERMRSGRFIEPTVSDISIEWLMQAYLASLQKEGKNIHVLPVAINYDRLFEIRNLAQEIVSSASDKLSMVTVLRMLKEQSGQSAGKVYMTFGQPISMQRFLINHKFLPLTQKNLDEASLQMTQHLVLQQELASPVVLNMIVATLLLQTPSIKVPFSSLFAAVRRVFDYLEKRGGVKMVM